MKPVVQSSHLLGVREDDLQFKLHLASHHFPRDEVNYKLMRDVTVAAIQAEVFYPQEKQSTRPFPNALKIYQNFDFNASCLKTQTLFGL